MAPGSFPSPSGQGPSKKTSSVFNLIRSEISPQWTSLTRPGPQEHAGGTAAGLRPPRRLRTMTACFCHARTGECVPDYSVSGNADAVCWDRSLLARQTIQVGHADPT